MTAGYDLTAELNDCRYFILVNPVACQHDLLRIQCGDDDQDNLRCVDQENIRSPQYFACCFLEMPNPSRI